MGKITIEVPQNLSRHFRFNSQESAEEVLMKLEQLLKHEIEIDDDDDILGLWSNPPENNRQLNVGTRRNSGDSLLSF